MRCVSGKRCYSSKRIAKRALKGSRKGYGGQIPKTQARPKYVYACGLCAFWHTTSQKPRHLAPHTSALRLTCGGRREAGQARAAPWWLP